MKLYRQRPVIIEAEMFDGAYPSGTKIVEWCKGAAMLQSDGAQLTRLYVGDATVQPGQYVVRDVDGSFRVLGADSFGSTYEPVLEL